MTGKELLSRMQDLRMESGGRHLCCSCIIGGALIMTGRSNYLQETTQDTNACPLFLESYNSDEIKMVADDETGNTRVFSNGIQTIDNGGGYWVIGCPFRVPYPTNADELIIAEAEMKEWDTL